MPLGSDQVSGQKLSHDVLQGVRRREPDALGRLFDIHYKRIYNLALRLMTEPGIAEDVVHEVFLRVYKAAHQLDVERDPGPWLTTITVNLCREMWRSKSGKQAKQTTSLDAKPEIAMTLVESSSLPDEASHSGERDRILAQAVSQLPESMRTVVVLHCFQGLSHEEISRVLGEEAPAVRKRYSRALGKLRELIPEGLQ